MKNEIQYRYGTPNYPGIDILKVPFTCKFRMSSSLSSLTYLSVYQGLYTVFAITSDIDAL